ncbi:Holliday junction ATP-dependent DNA helicase RuvA [Planctomycetales bacterium]|nr:Holliday junction ATP-dependent DNA helicase RuvA [Planctomycetales bacterium]GHV23476.1 Holliday junction ATP-dependent DNA helicase RuvA [Planctomycetales bacterium]
MYNHLRGTVVSVLPAKIILEVGGVGYELLAPLSTTGKLRAGGEFLLLTHLLVREDALTLYAFITEEERHLFRRLINLSGIGATTANQILSAVSPAEFMLAIEKQDASFLKKIKGIGEKTAKRIILELKGAKMQLDAGGGELRGVAADAALALETLGMSNKEALAKVEKVLKVDPTLTLEAIVAAALQDR